MDRKMSFKTSAYVTVLLLVVTSWIPSLRAADTDKADRGYIALKSRRFLMTHHVNMPWMSWRQHVACLTTCIKGYEAETLACCTTGDNRLCLNLPFGLLNSSIGKCPDFCQRQSAISCGAGSDPVCGSDGVTYRNMCEFSKAVCRNDRLAEVMNGPCSHSTTSQPITTQHSTTMDPLFAAFCLNKDNIACGTGLSPICGSDKQFYYNNCEYSKAFCDNRTLQKMPTSFCTGRHGTTSQPISTQPSTTMDPISPAFCLNKNNVVCGTELNPICGSDKQFYLNNCEYSKAFCDNRTLQKMPTSFCTGRHGTTSQPISTQPSTTMEPIFPAFCLNKNNVVCGTELNPICGSDKQFYLNNCEYSKGWCDNRTLQKMPTSFCTGR